MAKREHVTLLRPITCIDCLKVPDDDDYLTMINPEGGYGQPLTVACDDCMRSGRWAYWISKHWPTWPENYGPT